MRTVDGHNLTHLTDALTQPPEANKPTDAIANTTKGKGTSFMEDVVKWHHGLPSDEEYAQALAEIDAAIASQGAAP